MKKKQFFKLIQIPVGYYSLTLLLFLSCGKDDPTPRIAPDEIISPTIGTRQELTLDSIFLYARQIYLWNEALPSYTDLNPRVRYRSIIPELMAYQRELYDISQLKTRENGQPYEYTASENTAKYSFLEASTVNHSAATQAAVDPEDYKQQINFFTQENHKIAYLYLNNFPELSAVKNQLDQAFAEIHSRGSSHLIIDLRSNGGGYLESAEYLANLIAPTSLQGKMIFSEQFNSRMQDNKATILQYQVFLDANGNTTNYRGRLANMADVDYSEAANTHYFDKQGPVESIRQLYFIVSDRTASAAEMLINVLKPYFNVKLIGQQTYGKPVGAFPIQIDKYTVYLASFVIRNADGQSDYFDGMPVDITATGSSIPDIGNPNETLLAAALQNIVTVTGSDNKSAQTNKKTHTPNKELQTHANRPYIPIIKVRHKLK